MFTLWSSAGRVYQTLLWDVIPQKSRLTSLDAGRKSMLPKYFHEILFLIFFKSLIFRDREEEREIEVLFHLFMHALVASRMCPDQGWNPQLWRIGTAH